METYRIRGTGKVFLAHCKDDPIGPLACPRRMLGTLTSVGIQTKVQTYEHGGHGLNEPTGVDVFVLFLPYCFH
jgi:predicted esterase